MIKLNVASDRLLLSNCLDNQETSIVNENGYESECSSSSRSEHDIASAALEVEADAFTRFIERQRMEVMFELRRLRLGERPVTGQPNRERIETFLNNIQDHQQDARVPAARPPMPSARIADINSLADRRCVSLALSSAAFRQDLENAVRQSIRTVPTPAVVQQQSRPPVAPTALVQQSRSQVTSNVPPAPTPQTQPSHNTLNVERYFI